MVLDADAWIGKDLNKFWFKTEVERVDGKTEEAEVQFLYSRAVAPFGISRLAGAETSNPNRTGIIWRSVSRPGPYLFEVDAGVFIGESGQIGARLDAEYEYMFTQKLVLSPEIELNACSKDDEAVGIGSASRIWRWGCGCATKFAVSLHPISASTGPGNLARPQTSPEPMGEDTSDVQIVGRYPGLVLIDQ